MRVRSLISSAFTMSKITKMKHLIDNCVGELINNLNIKLNYNKNKINVFQAFEAYSIDAIVQLGFGTKIHCLIEEQSNPLTQTVKSFVHDAAKHYTWAFFIKENFLLYYILKTNTRTVVSIFKNFVMKVTNERMKKYRNQNFKRNDFLQLMVDHCYEIRNSIEYDKECDDDVNFNTISLNQEESHDSDSTQNSKIEIQLNGKRFFQPAKCKNKLCFIIIFNSHLLS